MGRRVAKFVLLVALLGAWGVGVLWMIGSGAVDNLLAAEDPPKRGQRAERPDEGVAAPVQTKANEVRESAGQVPAAVWDVVGPVLEILAIVALALLAARMAMRYTRRYERLTLVPYRSDEAPAADVVRMVESWHQQLLERWWRRLLFGQSGLALEIATAPDEGGDMAATLSIVAPRRVVLAIEGTLMGCYPNCRVDRGGALPPALRVVRLKKRYSFVRALQSQDDRPDHPIDSLLNQMDALGVATSVQYAVTPTPAFFDRFSRSRFRDVERRLEIQNKRNASHPGLRSEVVGRELEGGMRVQHHPLFFVDIRIGGPSLKICGSVAGTLRGESRAENQLVPRHMRAFGRRGLYLRRLSKGLANPIPGWHRGVLSSLELGALWQLPSPALKGGRMARSAVPRMPAPPEVSRADEFELLRDEHGSVGLRPEDKSDGLGLIGGQKTGKTSVLCRTVRADALDEDCAVIVLMPKPGDALKALSMVPRNRTVRYLDLEHPEFGINPLLSAGEPAAVADKIVEAFRDVNADGDIRGSSDRYLRQAAQAAIGAGRAGAIEGQPTLWDMYRLLIPSEAAFRDRVVEAIYPDSRFADTATFFGRELPNDLREASSQTAAKLDAPRNKILRLLVEALDKVLRHPVQLSLDELVRRREVLIVDGKMGTFGSDNCRVMLQFILSNLYGALQRQQQLPEHERARVALKVDEAHLILNDSFADALATLRSAGLEVVAAWQYGEQIQDPKIRAGMLSLLRQRCMFSMGEAQDARELSSIAMDVYADVIHATSEAQRRFRLTPDTLFNLPNTYTVCSWISRGARVPAFVARTVPLEVDDDVVRYHLEAQQAAGCYVPERLPDPMPDDTVKVLREMPAEPVKTAEPAEPTQPAVPGESMGLDFAATSVDDPNERPGEVFVSDPQGAPESFTELDFDKVRGLIWDKVTVLPADRRHEPTQRELEILAALHSHRFLFATQIHRRWWGSSSLRAAQQGLNRMAKAGWVRRFKFQLAERGAQQRVYCLRRDGFELAQQRSGRRGSYIDSNSKWREPEISDPRRVLRDLHVNGWGLAFQQLCGRSFVSWRGPRESTLDPPRRRERGNWIDLSPHQLQVDGGRRLTGFTPQKFERISPDATFQLRIAAGESPLHFDVLLELDWARSAGASEDRLRRYDGLISGWAARIDRYRAFGTLPAIVFVCEDDKSRDKLVQVADRVVTACHAKAGIEEAEWPFPGRGALFFAVERDVHMKSLAALQLPPFPPELRVKLGGKSQQECRPRRMHIVEPRLLGLADLVD